MFCKVVIQQMDVVNTPHLSPLLCLCCERAERVMKGLARETVQKVLGHHDCDIYVVSFQNMSQHLSFLPPRFQQSGWKTLTNWHACHFIFLRYMPCAGNSCIKSRLWISWDFTQLVTAYITSLKQPHMAGLCSRFYSVLYNRFASKTKSGMPSAGDASILSKQLIQR